jgi:hypothetical protein
MSNSREVVRTLKTGLLIAVICAGCTSTGRPDPTGASAVFRHPTTGEVKTCQEEEMSMTSALFCIPCGVATVKTQYADCKSDLEKAGYERVRQEGASR